MTSWSPTKGYSADQWRRRLDQITQWDDWYTTFAKELLCEASKLSRVRVEELPKLRERLPRPDQLPVPPLGGEQPRHYAKWTEAEDARLLELLQSGKRLQEIASLLRRSLSAVTNRRQLRGWLNRRLQSGQDSKSDSGHSLGSRG